MGCRYQRIIKLLIKFFIIVGNDIKLSKGFSTLDKYYVRCYENVKDDKSMPKSCRTLSDYGLAYVLQFVYTAKNVYIERLLYYNFRVKIM